MDRRYIIIVDDEEILGAVILKMLGNAGLKGLYAPDAKSAQQLWNDYREEVAIVLQDVSMIAAATAGPRFKYEDPSIRLIYTSGYPECQLERMGLSSGDGFLEKPFNCAQLRAVLLDTVAAVPA